MQDAINFTDVADIMCSNDGLACGVCKYSNGGKCGIDFNCTPLDCKIGVEYWFRKEFLKMIGEDY